MAHSNIGSPAVGRRGSRVLKNNQWCPGQRAPTPSPAQAVCTPPASRRTSELHQVQSSAAPGVVTETSQTHPNVRDPNAIPGAEVFSVLVFAPSKSFETFARIAWRHLYCRYSERDLRHQFVKATQIASGRCRFSMSAQLGTIRRRPPPRKPAYKGKHCNMNRRPLSGPFTILISVNGSTLGAGSMRWAILMERLRSTSRNAGQSSSVFAMLSHQNFPHWKLCRYQKASISTFRGARISRHERCRFLKVRL